jgi:hypothetical protein
MQEEAESTFLKRYPDSKENHWHNNFWGIDRRDAKKLYKKNQFAFEE